MYCPVQLLYANKNIVFCLRPFLTGSPLFLDSMRINITDVSLFLRIYKVDVKEERDWRYGLCLNPLELKLINNFTLSWFFGKAKSVLDYSTSR
jgi:hypothetical protein